MGCEAKEKSFQDALTKARNTLALELKQIQIETEARTKKLADDFEADNDLASGVGVAAGTAIGGATGGPVGAVVGAEVGKHVGKLFTIDVKFVRQSITLDIPQTRVETRDFSFDVPTVVIKDASINFDVPTTEMRRQRGPDIPETRTRIETRCVGEGPLRICADVPVVYVEMVPSYYDVPVVVMKAQSIVVGMPTIELRPQAIRLDLPTISMKPAEFSADVPVITIRFVKDAGHRTADLAAKVALDAQNAANQKTIAFRHRLQVEATPLLREMFDCYREGILSKRAEASAAFEPQLSQLSAALVSLKAKGVPENDNDYVAVTAHIQDVVLKREQALKTFDAAVAKLNDEATKALQQFSA